MLTKKTFLSLEKLNKKKQILFSFFFIIMVSITVSENATTETKFKYGLELKTQAIPEPKSNQSLVQIQAAALNHR